jgi:hypothetical protein
MPPRFQFFAFPRFQDFLIISNVGIYHGDMKKEHVFLETPKKKGQPKQVRFVDLTLARDIDKGENTGELADAMKKKLFED